MRCAREGVFAHFGSAAPATNDVKLANFIRCRPPRSTHSPQIKHAPVDPHMHTHTLHHSTTHCPFYPQCHLNLNYFPNVSSREVLLTNDYPDIIIQLFIEVHGLNEPSNLKIYHHLVDRVHRNCVIVFGCA